MPKLFELLAVATGKKSEVEKTVTEFYKTVQKADLFAGHAKTYRPLADDGDRLPADSKNPQARCDALIPQAVAAWVDFFDVTLMVDAGNQQAKADIVVDDQVVAKDVPVTTLLALNKHLNDWVTFIDKLPTPDPAEQWGFDANQNWLATQPFETARTKKVNKPIVLFPATPEHPAQTQLVQEDVLAGYWSQVKFSTAVPAYEKAAMLARAVKLRDAVKTARERANDIKVEKRAIGADLARFVFGDYAKV